MRVVKLYKTFLNEEKKWLEKNNELYKKFVFKDFREAFSFIKKIADLSQEMNHHPTWKNTGRVVEIWLSTHDSESITSKDEKLSELIDKIYQ